MSPTEGIYDAHYAHGDWSACIKAADPFKDVRSKDGRYLGALAFVEIWRNAYPRVPGVRRVYASNVYDARALVLRLFRAKSKKGGRFA